MRSILCFCSQVHLGITMDAELSLANNVIPGKAWERVIVG